MSDERHGIVRQVGGVIDAATSGASTLSFTVVVLWLVHAINVVLGNGLTAYGIVPGSLDGLWGILFAPFLHGSVTHLVFNTVSLVLLGAITMVRRRSDFAAVSIIAAVTSGLGTWLFGSVGVHIGASGVIFGYLGFLMARGIFERSISAIVLSAAVTWFFGSMVWGVLPTVGAGISWEAHLFGFLGGIGSASFLSPRRRALDGTRRRG